MIAQTVWMKTSISLASLDQRISRLAQYLNEAQWRYQLVSTCCDIDDVEDDVKYDQSIVYSDESELDTDAEECEGILTVLTAHRCSILQIIQIIVLY